MKLLKTLDNKKKMGLFIGVPVILVAIGVALFFILSGPKEPATIVLSQYNQLEKGITYEETTKILKSKGTLQAESGEKDSASYMTTYIWQGKGSNARAVVTFHGNKLAAKTHIGLTE